MGSVLSLKGAEYLRTFHARMGHWRQDLGLVLDVLAERKDIDLTRLAYCSNSSGASTALPLIALEERLQTAILATSTLRSLYRELHGVDSRWGRHIL